ncbi:DNA-binding transcriptional regulator, LysR family [Billgrantia gudaonensis]|uniref:DNA-binding transcriptional regulator, LysR family n=2 Tax=Billgrantia gudaonensis TaxID=376427 RepID=A0A1G8R7L2_9GAMM|nr:DNA-binding transcriptional regulator, LysR family [Halomonas gudaonensis]
MQPFSSGLDTPLTLQDTDMLQDLNDALIFAKVVEQGSFIAAAKQLRLSKTTVSRKVQALERRLGSRLLHRTTLRLSLTEAGSVYFDYCNRIAHDIREAESAVQRLEDTPRGWLRITAPFTMCTEFTAALVRDFRELYPEVKIDLVLSNERLDLVAQQIDVALRVGPLPDSTLVARPLARYRSFVYASEGYIARHGEPREPADLAHLPTLAKHTDRRGQHHVWTLRNGAQRQEVEIDPIAIANDPFVLRGLLIDGSGLMLASEIVACLGPEEQRLRRVLEGWEGPEVELHAVFPVGTLVPPKVRTFVDFVVERVRLESLSSPDAWPPTQPRAATHEPLDAPA